jgi:tRNA-intron endonuclease
LSFQDIVKLASRADRSFWQKLVVYADLRDRGLRAQPVEGTPIVLVERKFKEGERRYMVLCLEEGVRIGFKELEGYIRRALEARRELVLAIVDKDGNVSYYAVERSLG